MLKTRNERNWIAGGIVGGVLLVIAGLAIFIGPQHAKTSDIDSQIASAELQNGLLQGKINNLSRQLPDLDRYKTELANAQHALPSSSGLPDFLRTLQSIGQLTGTDVTSYKAGTPTAVTAVAGAGGAAGVKVGSTPVYALPLNAQVSGPVANLHEFLSQLQQVQPRAVLVSQITENTMATDTGGAKAGDSFLSITMQAFVAPIGEVERTMLDGQAQK